MLEIVSQYKKGRRLERINSQIIRISKGNSALPGRMNIYKFETVLQSKAKKIRLFEEAYFHKKSIGDSICLRSSN